MYLGMLRRCGTQVRLALTGLLGLVMLAGCGVPDSPLPPGAESTNTIYTALPESSPRYLDPTSSYTTAETPFVFAVYEPPYRYNYLKRPYVLEGRAAEAVAEPRFLDKNGHELPATAPGTEVAESIYDIHIRKGIMFAPHPAFAKNANGEYVYHHVTPEDLKGKYQLPDFPQTGTRELVADDFVYAIRRLATPRVKSPVFSTISEYIVGIKQYAERLKAEDKKLRANIPPTERDLPFLDLRKYAFSGAEAIDPHTLRIHVIGKYPQFKYWLSMTFFAPIPWEAEEFYAQPGMAEHNFSLNYWPAGTGAYMMTEYKQNERHVMERNPNFRGEPYPCEGEAGDKEKGLLDDCGKKMPFVDKVVFTIEKESVPNQNKFIDGFYDEPDFIHPEWGTGFVIQARDSEAKAKQFRERGMQFPRGVEAVTFYVGFNWWDPVVGKGKTADEQIRNRKLRQAIGIAVDWEEYAQVFERKAGPPATGPLPPPVFGFRTGKEGMNPFVYDWVDGHAVRKPIEAAKKLLAEAGYPDGRDAKTGKPLVLNYDYEVLPTPELKAEIEWMVKQFAKLGIQLEVRVSDFNRFQQKMENGSAQIFWFGWNADYPDSENFLFLLYGPNSKAATHGNGENDANYQNDEYDRLFEKMKFLDDGPEKQAVIDRMVQIAREDSPWLWGFHPYAAVSYHDWVHNAKPTQMVRDLIQYRRIDPERRAREVAAWNKPIYWPIALIILALILAIVPAWHGFRKRERASAIGHLAPVANSNL